MRLLFNNLKIAMTIFLTLNAITQEKRITQTLVSLGCFISFALILVLITSLITKDVKEKMNEKE